MSGRVSLAVKLKRAIEIAANTKELVKERIAALDQSALEAHLTFLKPVLTVIPAVMLSELWKRALRQAVRDHEWQNVGACADPSKVCS